MSEADPIYKELAVKMGQGDSKYMPRILEKLASLEQAKIVRELPAPPEEIARTLNIDKEVVDKHLRELYEKGLIVPTKRGLQMSRSPLQLHDSSAANPKYDESLGDEFFDLWAKIKEQELDSGIIEDIVSGEYPGWRVIPRWQAIKDASGVLPFEDVREILKAKEIISVVPCPCKRTFRHCECGSPVDVCINVDRTAQYNVDRGTGKKNTIEEALQAVDESDKHGLVHITLNQKEVNQAICNCHWSCCEMMRPMYNQSKYRIYEGIAKSRFEATVEPEKCEGCKTCVDRCQFGAVQMKYYPEIGEERSYIDTEKCMGCGVCVVSCPHEARTMKLVRPPEHVPEAYKGIW